MADLVLTDKLKEYAEGYGLDAAEVIEDIRIWDMTNGHRARYVSLDGFFMGWVRREAKKAQRRPAKMQPVAETANPKQLSEKQEALAHKLASTLWEKHKHEGFTFQPIYDDVKTYLKGSQTADSWQALGNGLPNPLTR